MRPRVRQLTASLFVVPLLAGCLSSLHPVPKLTKEEVQAHCPLPPACCNHVYVFIVHGVDPLDYCNLAGVREYLHALGYLKIYSGQVYHCLHFAKEMRQIHQDDQDARFALVGFGIGTHAACMIAEKVAADGITIDTLVSLGCPVLPIPADRPSNIARTITVRAHEKNAAESTAEVHYVDAFEHGVPTHRKALDLLAQELATCAAQVPVRMPDLKVIPEQAPTPRPVRPSAVPDGSEDEWSFLRPKADTPHARGVAPIAVPLEKAEGDELGRGGAASERAPR